MSWTDELPDDFATFDGLESVTLTPVAGEPISGVQALRHAQLQAPLAPLAGPLAMEPIEATFSLFAASLGEAIPRCGDTLIDGAGAVWTIVSTERLTLGSRWRVTCRKQVG